MMATASAVAMLQESAGPSLPVFASRARNNYTKSLARFVHRFKHRCSLLIKNHNFFVKGILSSLQSTKLRKIIMGNRNSVAIALNRIEGRLDRIEGRLDRIEGRLDRIEGRLDRNQGVEAKRIAKRFTVEILIDGCSQCHGLIIEFGGEYFIMTAAHVVALIGEPSTDLQVRPIGSNKALRLVQEETRVFITKSYITKGHQDIGIFRVVFQDQDRPKFTEGKISVETRNASEIRYYGESSDVFFEGRPVTVVDKYRVRTDCHSKPGCSGTPIFSEDGKIHSILHGSTKHRVKKVHSNGDSGELSNYLYVDMLGGISNDSDKKFRMVVPKYFPILKLMEDVELDGWNQMDVLALTGTASEFYESVENYFDKRSFKCPSLSTPLSYAADKLTSIAFYELSDHRPKENKLMHTLDEFSRSHIQSGQEFTIVTWD